MKFDINDFIGQLGQQLLTRQEAGIRIYEEIRRAENIKVGFLDQATENPDFYTRISRKADDYIISLKALHNSISPAPIALDQEMYAQEQQTVDLIIELDKQLKVQEQLLGE